MKYNRIVERSMLLRSIFFLVAIGTWFGLAAHTAFCATEPAPCSANTDGRQLDYWLGDWTITYPGAPGGSVSKVYLDLDKCLLIESWDGGKGHSGKNMFAYSSDDKSWHGMFADNQGRVHVFKGKVASGSAEFEGPSRSANGVAVLNRIKIVRVRADRVEQSWEKSTDHGATWKMEFNGQYSRRNR